MRSMVLGKFLYPQNYISQDKLLATLPSTRLRINYSLRSSCLPAIAIKATAGGTHVVGVSKDTSTTPKAFSKALKTAEMKLAEHGVAKILEQQSQEHSESFSDYF